MGGILGYAVGNKYSDYSKNISIKECRNEANVKGNDYVGGIVGNADNYVIELAFSVNAGNITGENYVGGYAGRANGTCLIELTNNNIIVGRSFKNFVFLPER